MQRWKEFEIRILHPKAVWIALLTVFSAVMLIITFSSGRDATIIGYITYVLSAYTMTVLIINGSTIVTQMQSFVQGNNTSNRIRAFIFSNKHSSRYLSDIPYRTRISLYMSLSTNLLYAVFKLIGGIYYASFWYGADALFYIALSVVRLLMLRHMRKDGSDMEQEYRQYRLCGCMLFALNAALVGLVYQVVNQDMGYHYPGLLIYTVATYTFACLIIAIINIVKYRKLNSPILSAAKAISLTRALVAIFALTTAMLVSFGGTDSEPFKNTINALTGVGVCLFISGMAVYMIIRANKNLRILRINNSET